MSLSIGLGVLTGQARPGAAQSIAEEYRLMPALAAAAESAGFDSVWVSEHHGAEDGYLPSLLPALAAIAAATSTIRLGTAVALAPFQQPLRFAEDCAVVDVLSGGRLIVGLAAGWRRREFALLDVPFAERAARTVDLVEICRAAWSGRRFDYAGRVTTIRGATVTPIPVGPMPIWLGGTSDPAVDRAGRLGDGFIASPRARLDVFQERVARFDRAAEAAGRDPERLGIGAHVDAWISDDGRIPEVALAGMRHVVDAYARWHAEDDDRPAPPPADEAATRSRGFMGTPEAVIEAATPWVTAFAERDVQLILRLHYPGVPPEVSLAAIRRAGVEVLPALRSAADAGSANG